MTIFDEPQTDDCQSQGARLSAWMLDQMAEGLEDQAAGLSLRTAGLEEEESFLCKEIARHETEVNRLLLRLESSARIATRWWNASKR